VSRADHHRAGACRRGAPAGLCLRSRNGGKTMAQVLQEVQGVRATGLFRPRDLVQRRVCARVWQGQGQEAQGEAGHTQEAEERVMALNVESSAATAEAGTYPCFQVRDICLLTTLSFRKCTVMVVLPSFQTASPLESPRKLAPEASTGSPKISRTSCCDMPSPTLSKFS